MYLKKQDFVRNVDIRLGIRPTNSYFVVQLRPNIVNQLHKSWISHFNVTYEILPIKKYASLWYNVWHISWDMSFVHGEARFCVKSWYTSVYRTKTNHHFVVQSRLNIANRLKKSWISHFYVTYEILPIKKYLSLWYNVWRISWDMSFVLEEARFCAKRWYTSGYQTNQQLFCCTVAAKYSKSTP